MVSSYTLAKTPLGHCCLRCVHPPGRTGEELVNLEEYWTNTIDSVRDRYPDCRIMLLGDFNNFDVTNLTRSLSLKQIVCSPIRGLATLDLIITDLHNLYDKPSILAPLRSADHSIVQLVHNNVDKQNPKPIKRSVPVAIRDPPRSLLAIGQVHINSLKTLAQTPL